MRLLQEVADSSDGNGWIFLSAERVLAHSIVQKGQRLIHNLLWLFHMIDALAQNTLGQKHQIKQEVERSSHVYTKIVQAQNVPL